MREGFSAEAREFVPIIVPFLTFGCRFAATPHFSSHVSPSLPSRNPKGRKAGKVKFPPTMAQILVEGVRNSHLALVNSSIFNMARQFGAAELGQAAGGCTAA
jgi:hypothetical protein